MKSANHLRVIVPAIFILSLLSSCGGNNGGTQVPTTEVREGTSPISGTSGIKQNIEPGVTLFHLTPIESETINVVEIKNVSPKEFSADKTKFYGETFFSLPKNNDVSSIALIEFVGSIPSNARVYFCNSKDNECSRIPVSKINATTMRFNVEKDGFYAVKK